MIDIRPFRPGDERRLDDLLDAEPDRLWREQGHRLHGPDRDGTRLRRTMIAEDDGRVVGAATIAVNAVHPGRYNAAIEVAPDLRRRGTGTLLLAALRRLRPEPHPFAGKVRERDVAARAFVLAAGGRPYQRCLCPTLRLDDAVAAWSAQRASARIAPFASTADMQAPFAAMYRWLHETWAPAGGQAALRDVAERICSEADPELSRVALADGGPAALALAFRQEHRIEVVAETVARDTGDGTQVLAATVSAVLTAAASAGVTVAEFDGHVDDPHLAPVVATMPVTSTDPLLLVELG